MVGPGVLSGRCVADAGPEIKAALKAALGSPGPLALDLCGVDVGSTYLAHVPGKEEAKGT